MNMHTKRVLALMTALLLTLSPAAFVPAGAAQPSDYVYEVYIPDDGGSYTLVTGAEAEAIFSRGSSRADLRTYFGALNSSPDILGFSALNYAVVQSYDTAQLNELTRDMLGVLLRGGTKYEFKMNGIIDNDTAAWLGHAFNSYYPVNVSLGILYNTNPANGYYSYQAVTFPDTGGSIGFNITKSQIQREIEAARAQLSALNLPDNMTDKEKAKAINDYLCNKVSYNYTCGGSHSGQYAYCALSEGKGVCNAYASAFSWMCFFAGVDAPKVLGDALDINNGGKRGAHAWNLVYSGTDRKYADVTWADQNPVSYQWFWQDNISRDHSAYPGIEAFIDWCHTPAAGLAGAPVNNPVDMTNPADLNPPTAPDGNFPALKPFPPAAPPANETVSFVCAPGAGSVPYADADGAEVWVNGGKATRGYGVVTDTKTLQLSAFIYNPASGGYYNVTESKNYAWGLSSGPVAADTDFGAAKPVSKLADTAGISKGKITAGKTAGTVYAVLYETGSGADKGKFRPAGSVRIEVKTAVKDFDKDKTTKNADVGVGEVFPVTVTVKGVAQDNTIRLGNEDKTPRGVRFSGSAGGKFEDWIELTPDAGGAVTAYCTVPNQSFDTAKTLKLNIQATAVQSGKTLKIPVTVNNLPLALKPVSLWISLTGGKTTAATALGEINAAELYTRLGKAGAELKLPTGKVNVFVMTEAPTFSVSGGTITSNLFDTSGKLKAPAAKSAALSASYKASDGTISFKVTKDKPFSREYLVVVFGNAASREQFDTRVAVAPIDG